MITSLRNYQDLVRRVDELCHVIRTRLAGHLNCQKGCDACCLHLSLFPVEAAVLAEAIRALPVSLQTMLRARATMASDEGACPLLEEHLCLVYEARPLICRTHGLPILTHIDGQTQVDFCPENCRELDTLTGDSIVDVDRLNVALTTVNALFVQEKGIAEQNQRCTIAEIILDVTG